MKKVLETKTSNKCPWCGGKVFVKYSEMKDKLLGVLDDFNIKECQKCGIAFTDPMPCKNLDVLYPSEYLSDRAKKEGFDLEKWYREDRYGFDFRLVEKVTGLGISDFDSYVDVGCGTGEQMVFVKERGCRVCWGIDKFDHLKVKEKNIVNIAVEDYKPSKKFRVVSLFAVLEHVVDPIGVLKHIRSKVIQKNGYLVIEVPNYGSIERIVFGKRWYCLDVPRHLWHYSEVSIKNLLERGRFEVVKIYKKNAWLHPVSFAPSLVPDADMGKVWGEVGPRGRYYWMVMRFLWLGLTILSMPINWLLSLIGQASIMTVVARPKE